MKLRPEYAHLKIDHVGDDRPSAGPPIVFCCDDNYAFPARVTIASLLINAPSRNFEIVVLSSALDSANIAAFDVLGRRLGSRMTIVHVNEQILPESFVSPYIARRAFLRLLLADMIDTDRLLYLDTDLVVQIDISSIWREYRQDMILGGVQDVAARDWKRRLGSTEPDLYLNSGVLLINSAAWRDNNVTAQCQEWLVRHRDQRQSVLPDQDALNNLLEGSNYAVTDHWNVSRNELRRQRIFDVGERYDLDTFMGIFHFNGPSPKPWCRWADPWSQDLYLRYARIVGLPPGYWVEARTPQEAVAQARWAEHRGDLAKANEIYRQTIDALFAHIREQNAADTGASAAPSPATVS